jgi:hypothetical protein
MNSDAASAVVPVVQKAAAVRAASLKRVLVKRFFMVGGHLFSKLAP